MTWGSAPVWSDAGGAEKHCLIGGVSMAGIERFFEGKVKPRTEHSSTGHTRLKVFWSYSVCKLKFFFKQIDSTRYAAKIACQLYVNWHTHRHFTSEGTGEPAARSGERMMLAQVAMSPVNKLVDKPTDGSLPQVYGFNSLTFNILRSPIWK